ncbi:MAG: phage tail protein [Endomicrobium sp.]|nr:phage tail protein [Endomicrobium sp.]
MKRLLVLLFVFFSFTVVAFSGVPGEIRYSGKLKSYNYPVSGNMPFNFKIYDASEGGTALWESGNQTVKLSSGVFTYIIKPDESMVDWRKKDLWLQIVVDGRELFPREKVTAQPYSFHSYSAENLSSESEIKIEIGENSAYIGMDGNSRLYYKPSQKAEKECLGVPPGTVIAFAGNSAPRGYLLCDGREIDASMYPDLFRAIGTIYGGNGSPKFKLPNFCGMFLRGAGGNAFPVGQQQGDAIRNITGRFAKTKPNSGFLGAFYGADDVSHGNSNSGSSSDTRAVYFDASRIVPTANENRPVNYAVNYYIKY